MVKYYAVTLTASPHKDRFKKLCWSAQQQQFEEFFERFKLWFSNFQYTFEVCPTSKLIHSHLCLSTSKQVEDDLLLTSREILHIFFDSFVYKFGYAGNPEAYSWDCQLLKTLRDYDQWEDYMYKHYSLHKCPDKQN